SLTSVSLYPVLVLVCLDNKLSGLQSFIDSNHFGVSMLSDAQEDVSRMFAKKDSERPPSVYFEGQLGMPLLRNSIAIMECEVVAKHLAGDHTIFEVNRSEEHTSELQSRVDLVCRLLLEKKIIGPRAAVWAGRPGEDRVSGSGG